MTTLAQSVAEAASEYVQPVRAAVKENLRNARRAVGAGRQAVEDCADTTVVQVRRHPFVSLGIAAGAGILVGSVIGFVFGRSDTRRLPK